jgi:Na+/proline symporter
VIRVLQFIAIVLTALCLVPAGAHVLELANKIDLDQDRYITVQQIYRGWALLGFPLIAAIGVNGWAAVMMRRQTKSTACAAAAAVLLCLGLVIFFTWTFPVNQVTSNWSVAPVNWQALRAQWEYSHAANAGVTFLALCSSIASSLLWSR